ncbi:MAG: Acetyltransferase, GNAT family, partial [uncultured Nocardioidaceae bacterium]
GRRDPARRARLGGALRRRDHDAGPEEPHLVGVLVPQPPDRREDEPVAGGAGPGRVRPRAVRAGGGPRRPCLRRRHGRRLGCGRATLGAALRPVDEDPARRRPAGLVGLVHPGPSRAPWQGHLTCAPAGRGGLRPVLWSACRRGLPGRQRRREGRPDDGLRRRSSALRTGRVRQGRRHHRGLRRLPAGSHAASPLL